MSEKGFHNVKRFLIFIVIIGIILIVSTILFSIYSITSANDEFEENISANEMFLNEYQKNCFSDDSGDKTSYYSFVQYKNPFNAKIVSKIFLQVKISELLPQTGSFVDLLSTTLKIANHISQDVISLKSFDEICNDCELDFFQQIGKVIRPDLKICQYKEFLTILSEKEVPPANFILVFVFEKNKFSLLNLEELTDQSIQEDQPEGTTSDLSEEMMKVLILRNLKKSNR